MYFVVPIHSYRGRNDHDFLWMHSAMCAIWQRALKLQSSLSFPYDTLKSIPQAVWAINHTFLRMLWILNRLNQRFFDLATTKRMPHMSQTLTASDKYFKAINGSLSLCYELINPMKTKSKCILTKLYHFTAQIHAQNLYPYACW